MDKKALRISIISNSMTFRPLTHYEQESSKDQHYTEISNDNQATYLLQCNDQESNKISTTMNSLIIVRLTLTDCE